MYLQIDLSCFVLLNFSGLVVNQRLSVLPPQAFSRPLSSEYYYCSAPPSPNKGSSAPAQQLLPWLPAPPQPPSSFPGSQLPSVLSPSQHSDLILISPPEIDLLLSFWIRSLALPANLFFISAPFSFPSENLVPFLYFLFKTIYFSQNKIAVGAGSTVLFTIIFPVPAIVFGT